MLAFYCDHFVLPLPAGHRFPMSKYRLLRERVVEEGILAESSLIEPPAADWADLRRVHTADYVDQIAAGTLPPEAQRRIGFLWSPAMVERARRSVGGTLAAAQAALRDGTSANLAGGTHHAFPDFGQGYCVFNDIAVAARTLLHRGLIDRALVVDLDVHQGDGTAAIFDGDPSVLTFSMHGERNYPFRKQTSDVDIALTDGVGDDEYLSLLQQHLPALLERAGPDLVFYLAGADPYEGDRLGHLSLSIAGLEARDRYVFDRCRAHGIGVAVCMGGGYAPEIDAIVRIHANTIREAARHAASGSALS